MSEELLPIRRVVKRDGTAEEFDLAKFNSAIRRAADEVGHEVSYEAVYEQALHDLQPLLSEDPEAAVHVEQVLDAMESAMIDTGYADVAKAFIRYRHRRDRRRELGSSYSRAISEINMGFASRGNAEDWLWAIGQAAAAQYVTLAELPARTARYLDDNYLAVPVLSGYGRTVERVSLSAGKLLLSRYLRDRHISKPKRLSVAMGHLLQLFSAASGDIAGEQAYYGFDHDLGVLLRSFTVPPLNEEIAQAMQSFVYSLNHSSGARAGRGLSVSLGLDTTEDGQDATRGMLSALLRATADGVAVPWPHVVFHVEEDANWGQDTPNRPLLDLAVELAVARGGVSFVWDDGYASAYFSDGLRVAAGESVSLRFVINAAKLVAEAGSEFHEALAALADAVSSAVQKHESTMGSMGNENFPALASFGSEEGAEWGFAKTLMGAPVPVGIAGLSEAARILEPSGATMEDTARLARVLASQVRKGFTDADPRYPTYPSSDPALARRLYDRDRNAMQERYGIGTYLPTPSVMPTGYPVADRLVLEEEIYGAFASTGSVLLESAKGTGEVMGGIDALRGVPAVLRVTR